MSGFTKGPWEFVASGEYGYSVLWNPETRDEILVTGGINDGDSPITWMGEELTDANKALIESAPDLLAALIQCREEVAQFKRLAHGKTPYPPTKGMETADAAIRKAGGGKRDQRN